MLQIARIIVSFSWIYQGLFPKLLHIAPLEQVMTNSIGFSGEISYWITKAAGVGELAFGVLLFVFYRSRLLILLNILALIGLLFFVVILQPYILIEAFNPVTTNIPLIGLSLMLLKPASQWQTELEDSKDKR